jgi:ParB/RepB/Spo0J family partition protein
MKEEKIELAGLRFSSNRAYGGEGDIQILAEDIKRNGLINPITVKAATEEMDAGQMTTVYEVIAGRRRVRAVTLLGWKDIPSRVLEGEEIDHADEIAGSENFNRMAMHPLDEAAIFYKLIESGRPIEELAKNNDRSVSAIWQRIQLLELSDDIKTLFRNGNLSLHSAAMLKSLSDESQKEFFKQFKNDTTVKSGDMINDYRIRDFISHLGHDLLFAFLKDKQCAKCETRTYYSDKTLFPELDNVSDSCLNHECYMKKWHTALTDRIKSLKGEHKTHAAAVLIVSGSYDDKFLKILGTKINLDGVDYTVLPHNWQTEAKAKEAGAQPCFGINITSSGKLELKPEYWKEVGKGNGSTESTDSKKKGFAPVVKLLDLPKAEMDEALDALGNSKRLVPQNFGNNVSESVFWRVMEIKAKDFNDPKNIDSFGKELFLKKHLAYLHGEGKKVFEMFVGKMTATEIAKLTSDKVFMLLAAMECSCYEMPRPADFEKEKLCDILKWADIPNETLKQLYQEEIRKRIPKKKIVEKNLAVKGETAKKAVAKKPDAKKSTKAKGKK